MVASCGLLVGGSYFAVSSWKRFLLVVFVICLWLLARREALPEAGVLQGFHYFSSEEHEQHRDRDDTENGAGH